MNNMFERLFGVHVDDKDTPDELNDVETLNQSDYDGAPFIPVIMGTNDDPLVVTMPGAVRTIDTPSSSWSIQRVQAAQNVPVQIANANPFRVRMRIIPQLANAVSIGPSKEFLATGNSLPVITSTTETLTFELNTKAEVWAVNVSAALDCMVIQEFADGASV